VSGGLTRAVRNIGFNPHRQDSPSVPVDLSSHHVLVEFAYRIGHSRLHRAMSSIASRHAAVGVDWIHEIKHDGYRLMGRRDPVGIRLLTRHGHDWADRYPLIVAWTWPCSSACGASGKANTCFCTPSNCWN
jgi:hypothetical protein